METRVVKEKKDDIISVESRIMIKTARYRINENIAIDQKIKACNNKPIEIKMEK